MMALPRLVIFDMDEVLCHYSLGRRLRYLAEISGTTARNVRAAMWDSDFEAEVDAGAFPDGATYLAECSRILGFELSEAQWLQARRIAMTPNTEVLDIARKLAQQVELVIFTNNGPLVKKHLDTLLPEARGVFQALYSSNELGAKKPSPESFRRLMVKLERIPQDGWFIDDKKSNVEGARIAGLAAYHFHSAQQLRDAALEIGFDL